MHSGIIQAKRWSVAAVAGGGGSAGRWRPRPATRGRRAHAGTRCCRRHSRSPATSPDTGRLTGVGVGSSPGDLPQGGHANAVFQGGCRAASRASVCLGLQLSLPQEVVQGTGGPDQRLSPLWGASGGAAVDPESLGRNPERVLHTAPRPTQAVVGRSDDRPLPVPPVLPSGTDA